MTEKDQIDFGTWSGNPSLHPVDKPSSKDDSRRSFLRKMGATVAAVFVGGTPIAQGLERFTKRVDTQKALADISSQQTETELPADIIPREELLSRYNTTIHDLPESQFPSDFVELNFRRSIADVRVFQMLEAKRLVAMDVILVDSDYVNPDCFTAEQRAFMADHASIEAGLRRNNENAREVNRQEIAEHQAARRAEYQTLLAELEARRAEMSEDRYSVELQALTYRYDRYLRDEPTEEDLTEIAVLGTTPTDGTGTNAQGDRGPRCFVFIAVREKPGTVTFTSGEESITISASKIPSDSQTTDEVASNSQAPDPSQSYPTLDSFTVSDEANDQGYVVLGGLTPGFILRHELTHAQGVFGEGDADRRALNGILDAATHMAETGSDEKYWAVFRTPAGVTITQGQQDEMVM